jgi:hypothetical protein
MKKVTLSILVVLFACVNLLAQENKEFKPSGKAFAKIFTNFHTGIGTNNHNQGFELQRAYFGYKYEFAKGLTGKVTFDIGNPANKSKLENTAYVKNALINYKEGGLSLDFGLISTKAFKEQEKFWGYRYFFKSFQDQNKYNASADMGVSASYKLIDGLSIDATITNGEGYKKLQSDNRYRYGAGLTYKKSGLILRVYTDLKNKNDDNLENQTTLALFAAYTLKQFSLGAEYNMLSNEKFDKTKDISGISIYSTYKASKKMKIFARYDQTQSKSDWNTSKDGSTIIAGVEYSPIKNLKIAPNYQLFNPKTGGSDNKSYAYLSLQIAF